MLVQVVTGHETFGKETVKVYAFYKNKTRPEDALYQAARDKESGVRSIGNPDRVNASMQNVNNGQWITARYDMPEGSFLKLMIQRKEAGMFTYATHQTYLMIRKEAALRKLRIPFTGNDQANLTYGYVEGNFDVVKHTNYEALKLDMGSFAHQFETDPDDFYSIEVVEREIRPWAPVKTQEVKTDKGVVHVPVSGSKRLIRTRR